MRHKSKKNKQTKKKTFQLYLTTDEYIVLGKFFFFFGLQLDLLGVNNI